VPDAQAQRALHASAPGAPTPGAPLPLAGAVPPLLVRESMVTGQGEAIRRKPDLMVRWF